MSKSNSLENALMLLLFNATTFNGIAENDSTSPNTDLYVSLHTADPGEVSGAGTSTVTIRDIADTTDRIVASVDGSGNRTAVTLDVD